MDIGDIPPSLLRIVPRHLMSRPRGMLQHCVKRASQQLLQPVRQSGHTRSLNNTCKPAALWKFGLGYRQWGFFARNMANDVTSGLDDTQVKLLAEECLLVDEKDVVIGSATKKECHLMTNIEKGMLHRAFSVFLFNSKNELLLQQRADAKITFPGYWANTCCSHPLNVPGEKEEADALGVKRAAQRKLKHELGIKPEQVPIEDFHYITRIHYQAPCDNPVWGEHEIDYVLFVKKDVDVVPHPNEVQNYVYYDQAQVKSLLDKAELNQAKVSPWFALIVKNLLDGWWSNLTDLESIKRHDSITKL